MKKILGLDLGTNSIGWALIEQNLDDKYNKLVKAGSRIIPMSQDILGKFDNGQTESGTAARTGFRGIRRLRERHLLRRERLHRVLNILGCLPEQYSANIDFEKRFGQFLPETEPKIAYTFNAASNKAEFLFKNSFEEMLQDFKQHQPQLVENDKKIPYDWTIYFLRKKALTQKIEKEELAWLLLNFNQKRGYYQLRGEDDEEATKTAKTRKYFITDSITELIDTGEVYKGLKIIKVKTATGFAGKIFKKEIPQWLGLEKNIIATVDLDKDGNDKLDADGEINQRFTIPTDEEWDKEWKLIKIKAEKDIADSGKTVGTYIYDALLKNPNQKIKGKLVRVIERKFYREELEKILAAQQDFHPELKDKNLYKVCLDELYPNNEAHQKNISGKDFKYLFIDDIIFYQRPLKSKKSLISDCKFESRIYKDKDGNLQTEPLKCIAKSHPKFQEFRLWQFLHNLRIYKKDFKQDVDVTNEFLPDEQAWENIFSWLNDRKEVEQKAFLKYFNLKKEAENYRWNYVEDKSYPCNETRSAILTKLKNAEIPETFLTEAREETLWHILYSVEDKFEIKKALRTFALKNELEEKQDEFVEQFSKFPTLKKEYGAFSSKAINKLLPLMRMGNFWNEAAIDTKTKERIEKLDTSEFDEKIANRVREKALKFNLGEIKTYKGLPVWLASYIVYNRHSEEADVLKWNTPADIENYLRNVFKQHSLRNPIVEGVITETLRVVTDIWKVYGESKKHFFDEIHIELGREMKNPADKRKRMTATISENENTNLRLKALLAELKNDTSFENVRPYSPMQQEILKIYEEGALNSVTEIPEDILKIAKQSQPSQAELTRYKLWLDQKYQSPYTREFIPLSKLFTSAYEIEHIIPQSRFFDDSMSNKVICEAEVNKDKGNQTAYEYIKNNPGKIVPLSFGKTATLFTIEEYENHIKRNFAGTRMRSKKQKLLMEDIPQDFIQRQLNDSRYISKVVKNLLSNIVREENEHEAISKHVIPTNGAITSKLKQDWGLNDVWNEIITPRFERLNKIQDKYNFGQWEEKEGKRVFQIDMPLELQKGFSKKRIDHRHHALDAIIIACTTRDHVNYLNNENALGKAPKDEKEKIRLDLKHKLCTKTHKNAKDYNWILNKPWATFTQDAKAELEKIVVSFKQNIRVINKTVNNYQTWQKDENGKPEKKFVKQTKGENWAIRKPLHKDTVSGEVNFRLKKTVNLSVALENWQALVDKDLRKKVAELVELNYDTKLLKKFFKDRKNTWNEKDVSRTEIYDWDRTNVASRASLDISFDRAKIASITDTGIQKILLRHLEKYNETKNGKVVEHPELAFSPEGIEEMNRYITELNNGKAHKPILKVRTFEPKGNKFPVGQTGNKKDKFVEAAKGTNLFFAVYVDGTGKRSYDTIPLHVVIERQKQGLSPVNEIDDNGKTLLFYLSPDDLVYVPEKDSALNNLPDFSNLTKEQSNRIYKMVSSTGTQCFFINNKVATPIYNKVEFSPLNKTERSIDETMVKEVCWPLKSDRLGNLSLKLSSEDYAELLRKAAENVKNQTELKLATLRSFEKSGEV